MFFDENSIIEVLQSVIDQCTSACCDDEIILNCCRQFILDFMSLSKNNKKSTKIIENIISRLSIDDQNCTKKVLTLLSAILQNVDQKIINKNADFIFLNLCPKLLPNFDNDTIFRMTSNCILNLFKQCNDSNLQKILKMTLHWFNNDVLKLEIMSFSILMLLSQSGYKSAKLIVNEQVFEKINFYLNSVLAGNTQTNSCGDINVEFWIPEIVYSSLFALMSIFQDNTNHQISQKNCQFVLDLLHVMSQKSNLKEINFMLKFANKLVLQKISHFSNIQILEIVECIFQIAKRSFDKIDTISLITESLVILLSAENLLKIAELSCFYFSQAKTISEESHSSANANNFLFGLIKSLIATYYDTDKQNGICHQFFSDDNLKAFLEPILREVTKTDSIHHERCVDIMSEIEKFIPNKKLSKLRLFYETESRAKGREQEIKKSSGILKAKRRKLQI